MFNQLRENYKRMQWNKEHRYEGWDTYALTRELKERDAKVYTLTVYGYCYQIAFFILVLYTLNKIIQ